MDYDEYEYNNYGSLAYGMADIDSAEEDSLDARKYKKSPRKSPRKGKRGSSSRKGKRGSSARKGKRGSSARKSPRRKSSARKGSRGRKSAGRSAARMRLIALLKKCKALREALEVRMNERGGAQLLVNGRKASVAKINKVARKCTPKRKSSARKGGRKSSARKSPRRKSSARKSPRKSPRRKSGRKSSTRRGSRGRGRK